MPPFLQNSLYLEMSGEQVTKMLNTLTSHAGSILDATGSKVETLKNITWNSNILHYSRFDEEYFHVRFTKTCRITTSGGSVLPALLAVRASWKTSEFSKRARWCHWNIDLPVPDCSAELCPNGIEFFSAALDRNFDSTNIWRLISRVLQEKLFLKARLLSTAPHYPTDSRYK